MRLAKHGSSEHAAAVIAGVFVMASAVSAGEIGGFEVDAPAFALSEVVPVFEPMSASPLGAATGAELSRALAAATESDRAEGGVPLEVVLVVEPWAEPGVSEDEAMLVPSPGTGLLMLVGAALTMAWTPLRRSRPASARAGSAAGGLTPAGA